MGTRLIMKKIFKENDKTRLMDYYLEILKLEKPMDDLTTRETTRDLLILRYLTTRDLLILRCLRTIEKKVELLIQQELKK